MSTNQKDKNNSINVIIPENISVDITDNQLIVTGQLGTLKKDFTTIRAYLKKVDDQINIKSFGTKKKELAMLKTVKSLITNLFSGVTEGFTYKLKLVYSHFPMTVRVENNNVYVDNFIGGKFPRIAKIVGESTVTPKDDDVIVSGLSIENVSQTAANIESCTKIKNKDLRVFLDGVYIYEKGKGQN